LIGGIYPTSNVGNPEYLLKRERHRVVGRIEPGGKKDRRHLPALNKSDRSLVRDRDVEIESWRGSYFSSEILGRIYVGDISIMPGSNH
jgi:hypothetical protein